MPRRTIQLFPLLVVTTSGFCISKICPLRLPAHQVLKESNGYQPSNGESSEEMYWEKYSGTRIEEDEAYTKEDISWENGGQIQKYDDDDYYYDDEDSDYEDEEESEPGNYWSNPIGKTDRPVSKRRRNGRPPMYDFDDREYYSERPERKSRSSRRRPMSGTGLQPPPKPAKDFYERLFWYGFDVDQSEGVGDKTVFGGTKGKFNGLSYLTASERGSDRRILPPSRRTDDRYYDADDGMRYEDSAEEDEEFYEISSSRFRSVKPPTDPPYPRPAERNSNRREPRRRAKLYDSNYYEEDVNSNDWISKSVSNWFTGEDYESDFDNDGSTRRRRRRKTSNWSPFNVVDAFFGVDRDDMEYKADLYNERMGLRRSKRSESRSRRKSSTSLEEIPRRPGYAYRYDGNDDESPTVVDIDTSLDPTENAVENIEVTENNLSNQSRKTEMSWGERALAVERVPPAEIPAWGPSGELPYDARTKAIMDALEDIQTAVLKVEAKEKKEAFAREEITVLKVDAELERRKLEESRGDPRFVQEELRQIEFELDEASRVLRRARTQVGLAREELDRFRDRHWALLSFYDPDRAQEKVEEALNELQEVEPAARLDETLQITEDIQIESSESDNDQL